MGERIMVINDSQDLLEVFRQLLEEEGYQVLLFTIVPESLYDVERAKPDLIILDLVFGSEKLGWQLLQKLRMLRATAKIPVVVCTAAVLSAREMEPQLVAHGASLVLKPFDIDELLAAVRTGLDFRRTNAALIESQPPEHADDESELSGPDELVPK